MGYWKTSNKKQLSREILFDVSHNINRDFTPEMPTIVSKNKESDKPGRQELLEVSKNISLYYAPKILSNTQKLVLLPIDPEHCFVYWSLGGERDCTHPQSGANQELYLRVFSHTKECRENSQAKLLYETTVHLSQSRQKIKLRLSEKGVVYTASIGKYLSKNGFVTLINSNNVYTFYGSNGQNKKDYNLSSNSNYSQDSDVNSNNKIFIDFKKKSNVKSVKSHYASTNQSGQKNNK